jgi:hypothetical protein
MPANGRRTEPLRVLVREEQAELEGLSETNVLELRGG